MCIRDRDDILEEIVGDFTENDDKGILKIDENSYIFNGSMQVREINKNLGWKLEEDVAKTINGYILESLENIPSKGAIFKKNGYIFEVIEVSNNFVNNVKVTKK